MITLRPYQQEQLDKVRAEFARGHRRVLLQAPTGAGKGAIAGYIVQSATDRSKRVMIIAHRAEILDQLSQHVKSAGIEHSWIQAGKPTNQLRTVQIASIQTLVRRVDSIVVPDLVILDECFPAGTLVDRNPIETLKTGDVVVGITGNETVVNVQKRKPKEMVCVVLSGGKKIPCTSNHPFYTQSGWKPAKELTSSDMALSIMPNEYELHCLRGGSGVYGQKSISRKCSSWSIVLFNRLFKKVLFSGFISNYGKDKHEIRIGKNDKKQSDEKSSNQRKGKNLFEGNGMETDSPRRKWETNASDATAYGFGFGMEYRSCCSDESSKAHGLSNMLQIGRWKRKIENWCRNRWVFPLLNRSSSSGFEKRPIFEWVGVESVEVLEQTSDGTFGGVCPDGFVYNLEVTGSHTYTANGIVVHNCHHATSSTYKQVMAKWPSAKILGLTATPWRLDGSGLRSEFDVMVLGPTSEWLIDNGFLAMPVYYAPPKTVDVSRVKTRCGDYVSNELETLIDTPVVTGNAVEHYLRACPNEKAVAFCVSLKHSQHICDAFNASGISASTIDGDMEREERKRIMDGFRNGQIKVLTSVDLIGEGVDVPSVGAAILLRPTKSLTLHLQQIGRALRMSPGKERAVILDHAGNLKRHGLAETIREWSLDGQPKRKRGEQEERIDVKQCKRCYVVFQGGRCPNCQTAPEGREVNSVGGQLVQLTEEDKNALKIQRKAEQRNAKSLDDLIALGKSRSYKYPRQWAERLMKFRHERKHPPSANPVSVGETPQFEAVPQ